MVDLLHNSDKSFHLLIPDGTVRELNTSNSVLRVKEVVKFSTLLVLGKRFGVPGGLSEPVGFAGGGPARGGGTGGDLVEVNRVTIVSVSDTTTEFIGIVLLVPGITLHAVPSGGVVDVVRVIRVIEEFTVAPKLLVDHHVRHLHGAVVRLVVGNIGLTVIVVVVELAGDGSSEGLRVVTEETVKTIVLIIIIKGSDVVSTLGIVGNGGPLRPGIVGGDEGIVDAVGPVELTVESLVFDLNVLNVDPLGLAVPETGLRVEEVIIVSDGGRVTVVIDHFLAIVRPEVDSAISGPIEDVGVINEVGVRLGPVTTEVVLASQGTVGVAKQPREGTELPAGCLTFDGVLGEGGHIGLIETLGEDVSHDGEGDEKKSHYVWNLQEKKVETREKTAKYKEQKDDGHKTNGTTTNTTQSKTLTNNQLHKNTPKKTHKDALTHLTDHTHNSVQSIEVREKWGL